MKKFLLVILSALMLACLCAFVACNGKGNYHTLVFRQANGVRYVCDIKSGWEVKDGTTVSFKLVIDDDAEGEPVVSIGNLSAPSSTNNDDREILTPNSKGVYSFKIKENTEVRVDGIIAKGTYNTLIFAPTPGVKYNILNDGLGNGMAVKTGTKVRFTLTVNSGYQGVPEVYANNEKIELDGNNEYSFTMNEPTTVRVEGIFREVKLNFSAANAHVRYKDENDVIIQSDVNQTRLAGETVKFKVEISVYYDSTQGYEVLGSGGQILKPDKDGFYELTLENDTAIQVSALVLEKSFTARKDGGSGTANDPFRLSKPVDLYQMAMLINDDYWTDGRYFNGYYRLENDIDFEGWQAYIIGDAQTYLSFFAGNFDGNGHTISNFVITDEWIDQETYATTYITNVGLFGYVTPTTASVPAIYNLHLENFRIEANPARYPESSSNSYETYVGGLIGLSFGASVTGCTANGIIEVTGGNYTSYVGGLIGQQMSAYSSDGSFMYYSGVTSCHSDVNIEIYGNGFVYAVGGITGLLAVGEEHVSAYVLNSYSTGYINGGLNAGGIVGYASAGTSVINCYSTGEINSYSPYEYNEGYGTDEFYKANAGGIVGRLGFNALVYNCFSMGDIYAQNSAGSRYQNLVIMDDIAAYREHGDDLRDATTYEPIVFGSMAKDSIDEDFIYNVMHWNEEDWTFEKGMPVINFAEALEFNFKVTLSATTGFGKDPGDYSLSEYRSMANWYLQQNGIPEYVDGTNGMRSYSYFFDAELKNKVPYSFIPTTNVTLYVGYADYSQVWGTYFLGDDVGSKARLELRDDGTFEYRNGALNITSVYTWDGEQIVLLTTYLGELSTRITSLEQGYKDYYLSSLYNFSATVDTDSHALNIVGGYVQEVEIEMTEDGIAYVSTGEIFYLFEEGDSLKGVKIIDDFHYGEYYDGSTVYAFYGNGTGTKGETTFTYIYNESGKTLSITYADSSTPVTANIDSDGYVTTINSQSVKPFDGFTGTWEREFTLNDSYHFDGKGMNSGTGNWTYTDNLGSTSAGTYTINSDGVLTANGSAGFTAKINENGFLVITKNSQDYVYYADGSFAGEWYYNQSVKDGSTTVTVTINLTLNGISQDGYGTAKAVYGTGEKYDLDYTASVKDDTKTIYIYNGVSKFAELTFDKSSNLLTGELEGRPGRVAAYDNFRGTWVSENSALETVTFNGIGYYNLPGDAKTHDIAISGTVQLDGKSAGKYSINRGTMTGKYTYNGVEYTLKYNESTGYIDVTASGVTGFTLQPRDEWYTHQLIDEEGYVYSFDGRGRLPNGGKMTADNGEGTSRSYTYKLDDAGTITVTVDGGSYSGGTISIADVNGKKVFQFARTSGGNISLTRHTPFTGKWAIGGERGTIEIDKIYADNTAEGKYTVSEFNGSALSDREENINLTYDLAGGFMTFELDGETYYINAVTSGTATELSIGPDNSTTSAINSICINSELKDEYAGKIYKVYDPEKEKDTGETLIFDGLSKSVFRGGTVVLYNAKHEAVTGYNYTIDELGVVRFIVRNSYFYMVPWNVAHKLSYTVLYYVHVGEEYFAILQTDWLRGVTATDTENENISYEFNGGGGVTKHTKGSEDVKYTYIILIEDNLTGKHVIGLSEDNGATYKYSVTLVKNKVEDKSEWKATVKEADDLFGLAVNNAGSDEEYFLFDGVSRVICFTAQGTVVEYTYKIVSEINGVVVLSFKLDEQVFVATLDRSSENAEDWTITLTKA